MDGSRFPVPGSRPSCMDVDGGGERAGLAWLRRNSSPALLIAIPIIFQPEIRRFLERVGRTGRWPWPGRSMYEVVVDIVADTALSLSANRHGAIIVFEREATLEDHIETGVKLDAVPSTRLLGGVFYPNSALHDGAGILRGGRVLEAGGVVVGEGTGGSPGAGSGRMISRLDGPRLRGILRSLLVPASELDRPVRRRLPGLSPWGRGPGD